MHIRIKLFLVMCSFLVTACSPLLSPETQHQLSHVCIEPIPERSGQMLRHLLTNQCKSFCHPKKYALKINLQENTATMELGVDAKSNLQNVSLTAIYELKDMATGQMIDQGQVTCNSSKTLTRSYYSRTTADQYILQNNIMQIQRLLLHKIAKALTKKQWKCACPLQCS